MHGTSWDWYKNKQAKDSIYWYRIPQHNIIASHLNYKEMTPKKNNHIKLLINENIKND